MNKIIALLLLQLLFINPLQASEPVLAMLLTVYSNDMQKFSIGSYSVTCKSYGVVSLDELMRHANINATCKKSIKNFQRKNPLLNYLSEGLLHVQQLYHIDFRKKSCIIYAKGELTLAEILLENGLAQVSQKLSDKYLLYRYKNAQRRAKFNKKGMFSSRVATDCLAEFLKVQ